MTLSLNCHWEYKPLFKKVSSHIYWWWEKHAVYKDVSISIKHVKALQQTSYRLWFIPLHYMVKDIVKKSIQRDSSLPSLLQQGHCMTLPNLCEETQLPSLPYLWLPILLLEPKICLRDKVKIDIVIRSEVFRKKINEKIDLWVESNSNSPAANLSLALLGQMSAWNYVGYSTNIQGYKDIKNKDLFTRIQIIFWHHFIVFELL